MSGTYNPFDPEQVDRQDELLSDLRPRCPVVEAGPGVFLLTRYDDVVAVSKDAVRFPQAPFRPLDQDDRGPDEKQLGESNPPEHAKIRKLLQSVLSPPRVRAMEPHVRAVCEELAGDLARRDRADIVAALGRPLPTAVIGVLTGVPEELRPVLHTYSDDVVAMTQSPEGAERDAAIARVEEFDATLLEVIRERRRAQSPPDDAMTALVRARDDSGRALSDEKVLLHLSKDLITGGIDTTTHLVGNLFWDLLTTGGAYEQVRHDRSLVPLAVEESLRHRPIVSVLFRQPAADVTISDTAISAGSIVALSYASANHDESVFANAAAYDLSRDEALARRHLGFGWGIHLCVGAALARLEATTLLSCVLDRIPRMRLAPDATYERVRFFMMRGPTRVDVEIDHS
jgi:cytochrome P450